MEQEEKNRQPQPEATDSFPQNNITRWKSLLHRYLKEGSFRDAERLVKRILEFGPGDEEIEQIYQALLDWKYLDVRNGVLVQYTGRAKELTLPECVTEIESGVFQNCRRLVRVTIPTSVMVIGAAAFRGCGQLRQVNIQSSVEQVAKDAFENTPYDPVKNGHCLHCGGSFTLFGTCRKCSRKRDY